jgi:hypothetical protein
LPGPPGYNEVSIDEVVLKSNVASKELADARNENEIRIVERNNFITFWFNIE